MDKVPVDTTELVDYNEEEDAQLAVAPIQETEDAATKGHYVGVGASGFQSFFLKDELMKSISECGFEHPSEVQSQCIPKALMKGDILCQARSGMGKTCVFVISILQNIEHSDHISCVVICHTREMAVQVTKEFHRLGKFLPNIVVKTVFGGLSVAKNIEALKGGCDILVGTPGRIADLLHRKVIDVSKLRYFIVDECDLQINTLNSRRDIQEVFKNTPFDKQVMMFTATLPAEVKTVCLKFMKSPLCVEVDDKKLTLHGLRQFVMKVSENTKNRYLTEIMDNSEFNQLVIYTSSNVRAKALQKLMNSWCFPCLAITSNMPTEERMRHFIAFKERKTPILITTDLFGRGVDVEKVNMVINYDFPATSDAYLHRVGRAGRFGTSGITVSFVASPEDEKVLGDVESRFETKMHSLQEPITKESWDVKYCVC
ncbi:ATP-dependent RNA helicase [Blastocystis sp. subtype 4]|uniref:ATP-dependent RNA helicase n=1 Tax=Blastocystis sp. subtype 4 TaxID=944170 RepID=UPI000711F03F|nr:ATP-dependent RNA helicase [Blastocystis sp. subtype 4]KNB44356.1 ATP-dependent RNA helicase [Blastocystis sp. subtype 4]|eukprot:XP_014527801.1 ATP-dependent RNA helicase [Blastocystis sp. subtype 4]